MSTFECDPTWDSCLTGIVLFTSLSPIYHEPLLCLPVDTEGRASVIR